MDEETRKRINIDDLPKAEEEISDEEAKNVEGGITKAGPGTLQYAVPGNTIGGALADDPTRKMGDGSV